MNSYLPTAPPQLKDRINPDHWLGFVNELNEVGTPNADMLLTCGIFISCTCCVFLPKIKAEFEHKARAARALCSDKRAASLRRHWLRGCVAAGCEAASLRQATLRRLS